MKISPHFFVLAFCLAFISPLASAITATGQIVGTVSDRGPTVSINPQQERAPYRASAVGTVTARVINELRITNVQNMNLGTMFPGDSGHTVSPSDHANAGIFKIRGAPNRAVTVVVSPSVTATTASAEPGDKEILITDFTPRSFTTLILDSGGEAFLYVGATTADISNDQAKGEYSATYSVSTVYDSTDTSGLLSFPGFFPTDFHFLPQAPTSPYISIVNVSDLAFDDTAGGDAVKCIAPGKSDNAENGSFYVSGKPFARFKIELPTTVTMVTGAGTEKETIDVNTWTSNPSNIGTLGASGRVLLLVGGCRKAPLIDQHVGSYSGSYSIQVSYY